MYNLLNIIIYNTVERPDALSYTDERIHIYLYTKFDSSEKENFIDTNVKLGIHNELYDMIRNCSDYKIYTMKLDIETLKEAKAHKNAYDTCMRENDGKHINYVANIDQCYYNKDYTNIPNKSKLLKNDLHFYKKYNNGELPHNTFDLEEYLYDCKSTIVLYKEVSNSMLIDNVLFINNLL